MEFKCEEPKYGTSFLGILNILFIAIAFLQIMPIMLQMNFHTIIAVLLFIGYFYSTKGVSKLYNEGERGTAYFLSIGTFLLVFFLNLGACMGSQRH